MTLNPFTPWSLTDGRCTLLGGWDAPLGWDGRAVLCEADPFDPWEDAIVDTDGRELWIDSETREVSWNVGDELLPIEELRRDLFALIDRTPSLRWLLWTDRPEAVEETWSSRIAEVFPVGEYLRDELKARGWTTRDCAERMGGQVDTDELTLDLHMAVVDAPEAHAIHKARMGHTTAVRLERAIGVSAETWLNLDRAYRDGTKHRRNVLLGVRCRTQAECDARIPRLLENCAGLAAGLWALLEPTERLSMLYLPRPGEHHDYLTGEKQHALAKTHTAPLSGVVVRGGERPLHPQWVRDIVAQCEAANVPVTFLSWGDWGTSGTRNNKQVLMERDGRTSPRTPPPKGIGRHHREGLVTLYNVGRARSGRLLDGREFDGFPSTEKG